MELLFHMQQKMRIMRSFLVYSLISLSTVFCFQLTITDYNGFVLSIAGQKVVTDVTANDGLWHFICAGWTASGGQWSIYKDGYLADSGSNLAKGRKIKKGGMIVIGQEQDEEGGKFSAAESFIGRLTRC